MARSPINNPLAFPCEIARFLCVEAADVETMFKSDKLPFRSIPKKKRTVKRVPLRDFHEWLKNRPGNPSRCLANYETFLADFNAAVRGAVAPDETPAEHAA
ncbi:MAG: hypothetical protein ABIT37_03810 [Luteolibacter sp.]